MAYAVSISPSGLVRMSDGTYIDSQYFGQNLDQQLNAEIARAAAEQQKRAQAAFPQLDPNAFKAPTYEDYIAGFQAAMQDKQLSDYYDRILAETQGDLTEATRRLQEDYNVGTRILGEKTQLGVQRTQEDLTKSLKDLGVAFMSEQEQKQAELNKRGIGIVQAGAPGTIRAAQAATPQFDEQGNLTYTGGDGRAGTELGQLRTDQQLRKEAVQRTAQRGLQDIGLTQQRGLEEAGMTQQRAFYDATRKAALSREQLQQEKEQKAITMAQAKMGYEQQKRSLDIQAKQYEASAKSLGLEPYK